MKYGLMLLLVLSTSVFAQVNPDLPNPAQLTQNYLEEISKREIGQTRFAVKSFSGPRAQSSAGGASRGASDSSGREIQESDVYKLGKKGKKELFLFNRYRGFQIVSFADGLENPKLVGRFPVYNNWNSEMYYLEKEDRVLVVNTEYSYSLNHWQTNHNTMIYLIDVSRSEEPKIIEEISVPGYLEESRMVGDVLYTITNNGAWNQLKAQITSVKMTGSSFAIVDQEDIHGENRWVRTMNVVKEGEKYLVVSTLSDWSNKGDLINVHDITSEKGKVEKLFTAKARGQIIERSQTFFHKNHLFAVSNYQGAEANARLRVSVEAFPVAKSTTTVESKENMRVSVGDTNGQHASLQDVRVSGDMLYAFWVPANNIDPFDLFDISEPSKGIKHLGQLQFDGWISKAFPIEFDNRKFVIGLGWITPATSEIGRRYPQAKVFEIKKTNNVVKHEVVASLTLDSEEIWSSLNGEDKYFEVLQEKPGVYNIMFPVNFSKNWKSGAKIVAADLNTNTLSEGASIVGDQGWLNRVFVNHEVRAINTFSDLSLESFNLDDIAGNGIAKTVSILELARNIIDFKVADNSGFQLINHNKSVEIRQVALTNVDAEKLDTIGYVSVKGTYQWHTFKKNKIFIITSTNKELPSQSPYWRQEAFDFATLNVVDLTNGKVKSEKINVTHTEEDRYYYFSLKHTSTEKADLITIGNQIYKLENDSLVALDIAGDCQYFFKDDSREFALHNVGSEIFAFNTFRVKGKETSTGPRFGTTYSLPFIKKLSLNGNNVSCSASINVPGRAVMVKDNFLITSDTNSGYFFPRGINYDYISIAGRYGGFRNSSKTFSLKFNSESEVEVVDILNKDITAGIFEDGFITYTSSESRLDLWTLNSKGELVSKPQYLENTSSTNSSLITVKNFNGHNMIFIKDEKKVDLYEMSATKRLKKINVTSTFDLDKEDGSAEFIFAIEGIEVNKDLSTIFVSQGYFGMTEIIIK